MAKNKKESEELLAPDPFLQSAEKTAEMVRKRAPVILGGIAIVLGGILAYDFINSSEERTASTATTALGMAIDSYNEATELSTVLTSTSTEKLEKGYRAARDKLKSVKDKHPNTYAATLAILYEGDLAFRLKDFDEAATLFEAYLSQTGADDVLRFRALEGAGYAYEGAGKLDEALAKYGSLADSIEFYKDFALKHRGRVFEKKGQTADAIAAYQAIVDMTDSKLKGFAEERLKALQ